MIEVFIVDSDERSCKELQLITEACGYRVHSFTDGRPALEELKNKEPSLLITELLLPTMDGFELCQAIRSELGYEELPILCLTGVAWGSVDLPDLLYRRFQARFLAKGMLVEKFLATLQQIMNIPDTDSAMRAVKDKRDQKADQEPVECVELKNQAESVVRAVMADNLDQGEDPDSENYIREQTDSVVKAVLEYRRRLKIDKPSWEYHISKTKEGQEQAEQPGQEKIEEMTEESTAPTAVPIGRVGALRLGESAVKRTRELTREFEQEVANVETSANRRDVRVRTEYEVRIEDLDRLDSEYTENISASGLFIRTENPPEKGSLITVAINLPTKDRVIVAKARVIHKVTLDQAKAIGRRPGCGVEFENLPAEDQEILKQLVQEDYNKPSPDEEAYEGDIQWIVLLGLPVLPIVGRPNFLLRNNIRMAEFPNLPSANDFLATHRIALLIIGETAFDDSDAESFFKELRQMVPPDTQHIVLDTTLTMKSILGEVSSRLNIRSRASPRVPHRAGVKIHLTIDEVLAPEEFDAQMINLSCGGMLLHTNAWVPIGTILHLEFNLPDSKDMTSTTGWPSASSSVMPSGSWNRSCRARLTSGNSSAG
jgi:uncharacterized protein (TIGR02266 family)